MSRAAPEVRAYVRDVPDFPRPGILFRDLSPLLLDPAALAACVRALAGSRPAPDVVVAIESRGFVFGTALALHWGAALAPARKFGKLPGPTLRAAYSLEYGEDALEMRQDAVRAGQRVMIVDDLLATGGTAAAAATLVEQLGGRIEGFAFVIELVGLGGRDRLRGHEVTALLQLAPGERCGA